MIKLYGKKLICGIFRPACMFWASAQNYKQNNDYVKMILHFIGAHILTIFMFVGILGGSIYLLLKAGYHSIIFLVNFLINFFYGHPFILGIVVVFLICYCFAYDTTKKDKSKQEQAPVEDLDKTILENSAVNGYKDMRAIVFRLLQVCGADIELETPLFYADIEAGRHYIINHGCVFYQFTVKKTNIKRRYPDNELDDDTMILQDIFNELWQNGEFTHIVLKTYTDNGVVLPPICFCPLMDIGTKILIQVVYTSDEYVAFVNRCTQEQNSQNTGYNTNDSQLL